MLNYHAYLPASLRLPSGAPTASVAGLELWTNVSATIGKPLLTAALQTRQSAALIPVGFKPQALFFDMDATLIQDESIDELAASMGIGAQVRTVTEAAMSGQIDFATALRQRVALLAGMPLEAVLAVGSRLRLNHGAAELVQAAQQRDIPCFLVSGGFSQLAAPLAARLGLTGFKTCELELSAGKLTGKVVGAIVDAAAKRDFVISTAAGRDIALANVVVLGDGANDRLMLEVAGLALGVTPKAAIYDVLAGASFSGSLAFLQEVIFPTI